MQKYCLSGGMHATVVQFSFSEGEAMKRLILAICCCTVFVCAAASGAGAADKVVFQKNSLYQYISVIEDPAKRERYIINNRRDLIQGGMAIDAPNRLILEYTRMAFMTLAYLGREPRSVLFVGLGAGSMPRYLNRHYPEAEIDVVEIDPDMVEVAKKYFSFSEGPRMKVTVNDGRVFLKRTKKKYDIIFLDAYQGGEIPFHLTTVEFLREVKARLKDDGVVVSNIISPFKNKFFDAMIITHEAVFPQLHIFKGRQSDNFEFIAPMKPHDLAGIAVTAQKIQEAKKLDINLAIIATSGGEASEYRTHARVLTDDFAPVNLYQHMQSPGK